MRLPHVLCLGFLVLSGCGDRMALTGSVNLKGQPLSAGMIAFEPAPGSETTGAGAVAPIRDGQFELPKGKHLPPGRYVVRVSPETIGSGADLKTAPPQFKPWETTLEITSDETPMTLDVP